MKKQEIINLCEDAKKHLLSRMCDLCESGNQMDLNALSPAELKAFPNPNQGRFRLHRSGWTGEPINAHLTNSIGQRVTEIKSIPAGTHFDWSTPQLPEGIYWLQVSNGMWHQTIPIVVQPH